MDSSSKPLGITPLPWIYEPGDSGDRSVGMDAYPPSVVAEPPEGHGQTVTIGIFYSSEVRLPKEHWTPEDYRAEAEGWGEGGGYRSFGSGEDNAAYIAAAANYCAGLTLAEMEGVTAKEAQAAQREQVDTLKRGLYFLMRMVNTHGWGYENVTFLRDDAQQTVIVGVRAAPPAEAPKPLPYRVTYSGSPERSGEVYDRFALCGRAEAVPTWEQLRATGGIPDSYIWYGTRDFGSLEEAQAFAAMRCPSYVMIPSQAHERE